MHTVLSTISTGAFSCWPSIWKYQRLSLEPNPPAHASFSQTTAMVCMDHACMRPCARIMHTLRMVKHVAVHSAKVLERVVLLHGMCVLLQGGMYGALIPSSVSVRVQPLYSISLLSFGAAVFYSLAYRASKYATVSFCRCIFLFLF